MFPPDVHDRTVYAYTNEALVPLLCLVPVAQRGTLRMDGALGADSNEVLIQGGLSSPIRVDIHLERPPGCAQLRAVLKQYITELLYQRMFMPAPFHDLQSELRVRMGVIAMGDREYRFWVRATVGLSHCYEAWGCELQDWDWGFSSLCKVRLYVTAGSQELV